MKALKELLTVMAILGMAAAVASGEDANTVREDGTLRDAGSNVRPADRPSDDGTVRPPERPADRPNVDRPNERPQRPDRPTRPDRPGHDHDISKAVLKHAPDALKKMIDRLHDARKAYHDRQKDLVKEAKGATDDEKDAIRDQLKDNRETFLDRTQTLRREVHKRVHELRDKLTDRKEVIDAARDENRDEAKERRGANDAQTTQP